MVRRCGLKKESDPLIYLQGIEEDTKEDEEMKNCESGNEDHHEETQMTSISSLNFFGPTYE
jgi:hypothetical protein